jgi:hypothetical protein
LWVQVQQVFMRVGSTGIKKRAAGADSNEEGADAAVARDLKPSLLLFLRTSFGPWLAEQVRHDA